MQRLSCLRCGDSIHPDTASKNAGLCMPCVHGNQFSIEERRERHAREREAERAYRASPEYQYWLKLIDRVYNTSGGFDTLSPGDRLYYLVNILSGEVHNGGFDQFFSNSSGDRYSETIAALSAVGANASLALLQQAKVVLFGNADVPTDQRTRWDLVPATNRNSKEVSAALDELDNKFYADPDNLSGVLDRVAAEHGLYAGDA